MNPADVEARHNAYRAGLCIDCRTAPYSAGRPRCNPCHNTWTRQQTQPHTETPVLVIEITLTPD